MSSRLLELDAASCALFNRVADRASLRGFFAVVSRLGDGVFWYALLIALPFVLGEAGMAASINMASAGLVALGVYRAIKRRTTRLRPFVAHATVRARAPVLDYYSFPSGHTLQAVSFTTVGCHHVPELAWILVPFAVLVAASRPVLGLHYPSDVAVGAALGWAIGAALSFP